MFQAPTQIGIGSGFTAGTNTLDFRVLNGQGPTGLLAALTIL